MEHRECSMSTLLKSHTLRQVSFLKCCNVTLRNIQCTLNKTTITTTVNCLNLSPLTSKSGPFFFFCKTPRNKPYHVEIPPKRFHLNGHTMGFCPQIQNLELHTKQIVPLALRKRFRLNGHAIGFHPQAQKCYPGPRGFSKKIFKKNLLDHGIKGLTKISYGHLPKTHT